MEQEKLHQLLQSMSRKEKIGQLFQIMGHMLAKDAILTGPLKDLGLEDEDIRLAGSVLGLGSNGADKLMNIQKEYMQRHPHQIPLAFMVDVIHGYKTIYPMPLAMGATFSPELAERCSAMAAREGAAAGMHVTFSPMVDLVRDARWGRVLESTGEDVYLNCKMAEAIVKGYQGESLASPDTLAACVKHFAGYGGAEGGRDYNTVEVSDNTLRDFYLPAYQAAVDAGAAMVMTSFNTINGIPATVSKYLMLDILRKEMNFKGAVISDFAAISETVMHGVSEDRKDSAKRSLECGCDIDMMAGDYSRHLEELIDSGMIKESLLDESVLRVLQLKNDLGLFENPFKGADPQKEKELCLCKEHKELARQAVAESLVLLKNEDMMLPLQKGQTIACIGPYVNRRKMLSSWAILGEEEPVDTIMEVAAGLTDYNLRFCEGCPIVPEGTKMYGFDKMEEIIYNPAEMRAWEEEAIAVAKEADQVVLFMGEHWLQSGEAASRSRIQIPSPQLDLLDKIYEVNQNIVLVLFNGRPLELENVIPKVKALLVAWMPGTMGSYGIWDVLTGKENPSGKLPMSFPYHVGQIPVHYDILMTGRPWTEADAKERFVSKYLDVPNTPLFSFGYGLSYTNFTFSDLQISGTKLSQNGSIRVSVTVKNTGQYDGAEVVQLYIRDISASVARPIRQLKGFEKVKLSAGEEKTVVFEIREEMLRFTRADGSFGSEAGKFIAYIGNSSLTENALQFEMVD